MAVIHPGPLELDMLLCEDSKAGAKGVTRGTPQWRSVYRLKHRSGSDYRVSEHVSVWTMRRAIGELMSKRLTIGEGDYGVPACREIEAMGWRRAGFCPDAGGTLCGYGSNGKRPDGHLIAECETGPYRAVMALVEIDNRSVTSVVKWERLAELCADEHVLLLVFVVDRNGIAILKWTGRDIIRARDEGLTWLSVERSWEHELRGCT